MNVTLQDGKTVLPVGYRITGAKLKMLNPRPNTIFVNKNGTVYYLNSELKIYHNSHRVDIGRKKTEMWRQISQYKKGWVC